MKPPSASPEAYVKLAANFEIHRVGSRRPVLTFADDVRAGLATSPKALPPRCLYDELGSQLFEAICLLPEYRVTRAESEVLRQKSGEIAASLGAPFRVVELGSGGSTKTRYVVEAVLRRQGELLYIPIDVSESAIEQSSRVLLQGHPGLAVAACVGDYFDALGWLKEEGGSLGPERTLVLFLGSTIGNLDEVERSELLEEIRSLLRPGDGFLLGADIQSSEEDLLRAYDDSLGVTAAFNLNILARINRELGGDADLTRFEHQARFDRDRHEIELHLVSRTEQVVHIRDLALDVPFAKGESIHTESSRKFTPECLAALAADTGFCLERSWTDSERRFSENLLIAC